MGKFSLRSAAVMPAVLALCVVAYKAYGLPFWGIGPLSFGLLAAALIYLAVYALTRSDSTSDAKFALLSWSALICVVTARLILGGPPQLSGARHEPEEFSGKLSGEHPEWWDEYNREFAESSQLMWHSYSYWRRSAYAGKLINVDDRGLRKTWNEPPTDAETTIHMFGGSTLWGNGARDDYTIPSLVSRGLSESNHRVQVSNHGEMGYVIRQSLIDLMIELQDGPPPDIVVFYDGVNDVFSSFQNREAGVPQNEENRREWFNRMTTDRLLQTYGLKRLPAPSIGPGMTDELLASETLRVYLATVRTLESLAAAYGFEALYYWQPMIYLDKPLTPYEQRIYGARGPELERFYETVYSHVRTQAPLRNFRDLSQVFSNTPDELYLDFCHINEKGNEIVAREIVGDLNRILIRRAQTQPPEVGLDNL